MPFESLTAIDHPLVCHVSGELTSGNYASDDFSLEPDPLCCPPRPAVHCKNSRCHSRSGLLASSVRQFVIFFFFTPCSFFSHLHFHVQIRRRQQMWRSFPADTFKSKINTTSGGKKTKSSFHLTSLCCPQTKSAWVNGKTNLITLCLVMCLHLSLSRSVCEA